MIRKIENKIKLMFRKKEFNNNAICGENLILGPESVCKTSEKNRIVIGDNCELMNCRLQVMGEGSIEIGEYSTIRRNSKISSVCKVKIGRYAIISNNVRIYDHNSHPTDPEERIKMSKSGFYGKAWSPELADKKEVIIDENVWIGEYSLILKGVHIGKGSIVGANSVVTKDVPPYSIIAGNPAKIVKKIEGYTE